MLVSGAQTTLGTAEARKERTLATLATLATMQVNCKMCCIEIREKAHRAYSSVYLKFEIMQTNLVCQRTSVWLPVVEVSSWGHWVEAEHDCECSDSHFICTYFKFMHIIWSLYQ